MKALKILLFVVLLTAPAASLYAAVGISTTDNTVDLTEDSTTTDPNDIEYPE